MAGDAASSPSPAGSHTVTLQCHLQVQGMCGSGQPIASNQAGQDLLREVRKAAITVLADDVGDNDDLPPL